MLTNKVLGALQVYAKVKKLIGLIIVDLGYAKPWCDVEILRMLMSANELETVAEGLAKIPSQVPFIVGSLWCDKCFATEADSLTADDCRSGIESEPFKPMGPPKISPNKLEVEFGRSGKAQLLTVALLVANRL